MPVINTPFGSGLRLVLQIGTDANGNPRLLNKSLTGVKATASDQDVYDVAGALAGLQQYPLVAVQRVDESNLVQS